MRKRLWIAGVMLIWSAVAASAQEGGDEDYAGRMPPRLAYVNGQVSFWRPGAEDWVQAQVNTALSPGDELYTGSPGTLELQIGPRAYARGWGNTQIGLVNHEPDFLQFKVTTGYASFDIRSIQPGHTVEVATPNGAFTIEHAGYYRVDVAGERTAFIVRRGGQAIVTPEGGQPMAIAPNEEVVLTGDEHPDVSSFAAPALDSWDRWNYARTDELLDSVSARYVPAGTYGTDDLDYHGRWRVVPDYGPVWIPTGVPAGWAPYSTGRWVHDPFYGWTWVDTAPWGWAPYHHGRWVYVNGFWGWAPGPMAVRPVYAPACVAFFGSPGVSVSVGIGGPVGWVALGWGEPIVPWWGRHHHPRPWWGGWGGPRVVNNVVINRTTVVNVNQINVYRNTEVRNAVVAVHGDRFGRGPVNAARVTGVNAHDLKPIHGGPRVQAVPASLVPSERHGVRPPERSLNRRVVATRAPHEQPHPVAPTAERQGAAPKTETRLVPAPNRSTPESLARPAYGQEGRERGPNRPSERPLPGGAPGRTAPSQQGRASAAPQVKSQEDGAAATQPQSGPQRPGNSPTSDRAKVGESRGAASPDRGETEGRQPDARGTAVPGRPDAAQPGRGTATPQGKSQDGVAAAQPQAGPQRPGGSSQPERAKAGESRETASPGRVETDSRQPNAGATPVPTRPEPGRNAPGAGGQGPARPHSDPRSGAADVQRPNAGRPESRPSGQAGSGGQEVSRPQEMRGNATPSPGRPQPGIASQPQPARRPDAPAAGSPQASGGVSRPDRAVAPAPTRPQAPPQASPQVQQRPERAPSRPLPGEPATRVAPNRPDNGRTGMEQRRESPPVPQRAPQSAVQSPARPGGGGGAAVQPNPSRPPAQRDARESGRGPNAAARPGAGPGRGQDAGRPGPG